jgi:hypothetical protein
MINWYAYLDHLPAFSNDKPDPLIVSTVLKVRSVPEKDHSPIYKELLMMVPKSEDMSYITFALDHERAIGHTGSLPYVNILCRPLAETHNYLHICHIIVAHLLTQVFGLLYKKVGHSLPQEWIEETCKLLHHQDPHPPYDVGHLIAVESTGVGTFKWACVCGEADPQAITSIPPDSSKTCIVALDPDLITNSQSSLLKSRISIHNIWISCCNIFRHISMRQCNPFVLILPASPRPTMTP